MSVIRDNDVRMFIFNGDESKCNPLDGEMSIDEMFDGEYGSLEKVNEGGYPAYRGPWEITPDEEEHVLETSGKATIDNIVVHKIPSNYGRIAWNGSAITVY